MGFSRFDDMHFLELQDALPMMTLYPAPRRRLPRNKPIETLDRVLDARSLE